MARTGRYCPKVLPRLRSEHRRQLDAMEAQRKARRQWGLVHQMRLAIDQIAQVPLRGLRLAQTATSEIARQSTILLTRRRTNARGEWVVDVDAYRRIYQGEMVIDPLDTGDPERVYHLEGRRLVPRNYLTGRHNLVFRYQNEDGTFDDGSVDSNEDYDDEEAEFHAFYGDDKEYPGPDYYGRPDKRDPPGPAGGGLGGGGSTALTA